MELLKALQEIRIPFLDGLVGLVTYMGDETFFTVIAMAVVWCISKRWGFRLLLIGLSGSVVNQLLKAIFVIPRPWVLDPTFSIVESAREGASGYSFPSGHTHSAVSIFATLAMWLRNKWATVVCVLMILLVGFSRMYLGVHTPLDVGVSLIVGAVMVIATVKLLDRSRNEEKTRIACCAIALALAAVTILYVLYGPKTANNMPEFDAHGVESVWKLVGTIAGVLLAMWVDHRYTHFSVEAPLWAQIVKIVGGLLIVVGVQNGLKPVMNAIFGDLAFRHGLRYFLLAAAGGALWPMTFRFFPKKAEKRS